MTTTTTFLEDVRNFQTIKQEQCNGSALTAVWVILRTNNRIFYIVGALVVLIVIIMVFKSATSSRERDLAEGNIHRLHVTPVSEHQRSAVESFKDEAESILSS